jgi:MYXO-CTERM domain-containing protein
MRIAKGCPWVVVAVVLASARIAGAAAVDYNLLSGEVTAITVGDQQTNRLVGGPVSLDAGLVSVDFAALLLDIISVGAAGPGVVDLDGINGWDSVTFSDASFASTQSTSLSPPVSGSYAFGVPVGVVANLSLDPVAPGDNVEVNGFEVISGAGGAIIALDGGNSLHISVNGVVLGAVPDPVNTSAPPVTVKADFDFVATRAAPEPASGALALLALVALGLRRWAA